MASTINASTSPTSGVITTADNSGVLQLQGNGAAGISINSYGAIGLGAGVSYGTSGQILTSAGSSTPPTWSSASSLTVNTATNLAGGGVGYIPYQSASGTTAFLNAGTAGQALVSNGTGNAPSWGSAGITTGKSIAMAMIFGF
jgi:hypothetical protein